MANARAERRLAAILAADVVGYSRLVGANEEGTLAALRALRRELIDPGISDHKGRLVKTTGDGLLVEFQSVVDALRCGMELQRALAERNAPVPAENRIEFRIGIHQGDILVEDGDIFGDGVNVAARLEALADPGGICVSARVQEDAAGKLALDFEDLGEQRLKNIARPIRVYRLVTEIGPQPPELLSKGRPHAGETPAVQPALPLPEKPSIAVLPFQNISGDPEQEYFADGMVEEIITALSRIRWLFVIARNSSFTYKGQAVDVKQVGRELGVRYVLEGSVRKGGDRVRITAQLIEAESGAHLWADRFDGSLEDVFELQDKVAFSVAGVIEPTLQAAEIKRSVGRPTGDLTAYDLYLRALAEISACEKDRMLYAIGLLDQAIAREPRYAPALALAATYRVDLENHSWTDDTESNRAIGVEFARRALREGSDDPTVLGRAALALGRLGEDIDAAVALIDRALALNPSFANGWYWSGWLRLMTGDADRAIQHFEASLRLSPRDQQGFHLAGIGTGLFIKQRFEEAAATLRVALEALPSFTPTYRALASCYAHMGRAGEAREIVRRLQLLTPAVIPTIRFFREPEHVELYLSGLRRAMDGAG